MKIRVFHNRANCIGCYFCVAVAFQRWQMSKKDGKSVLLGGKEKKGMWSALVDEDELESNLKAEKACPPRVIRVQVIP